MLDPNSERVIYKTAIDAIGLGLASAQLSGRPKCREAMTLLLRLMANTKQGRTILIEYRKEVCHHPGEDLFNAILDEVLR